MYICDCMCVSSYAHMPQLTYDKLDILLICYHLSSYKNDTIFFLKSNVLHIIIKTDIFEELSIW